MTPLLQLLISEIPDIVTLVKAKHAAQHPDAPPLTSADIIAGFDQAFSDSIAKDEMLRKALQAEIDAA
jgi:hypothetical protein